MGSIVGSVGSRAGLSIPITAAGTIVLTSLPGPWPAATGSNRFFYTAFEFGWRAFMFQLVPGSATGLSIAISATLDQQTAQGATGANVWASVPPTGSGGAGNFINPITESAGQQLCYVNSGPWAAFQLTVTGTTFGTGAGVLFGAGA